MRRCWICLTAAIWLRSGSVMPPFAWGLQLGLELGGLGRFWDTEP